MPLSKLVLLFIALAISAWGQESLFLGGAWAGNITPTSASVTIRLKTTGLRVRLQTSVNPGLTPATYSSAAITSANAGNTVTLTVQGLQPDTDYYYGVEVAGALRAETVSRGRFRTFPLGRSSFKIAFGSCGDFRAPNQAVYDAILREKPLLFIETGDLHYSNTNTTNPDDYRSNYDQLLQHPVQGAFFRSLGLAYMWDDHDFCGDNTDTTAVGRDSARLVYKERVPHYPFPPNIGGTVGQAFTIGRARVIMTDLRSAANPTSQRESAAKTRMGTAQKAWFKQELISARDNGFPLILWVCPDPWIAPARVGDDTWGGHATERTELANFLRDNQISNVVLLAGDMHGLAFDDGTNSDYATGGGAPLTVLHAAALTAAPSVKGGPYTVGPFPGDQQFGILEVFDNGGPSVACRFQGIKTGEGAKITQIFSSSAAGAKEHALVNISTLARINSANDTVVSGFVISGSSNRNVLVRAIGPTLSAFGVGDALPQPVLSVFQGDQQVATNAAWAGNATGATDPAARAGTEAILDAFDRAGAFRLVDETSHDAALVLSLAPGPYTVQVRSGDGSPGAALLEVYDLP